MRHGFILLACTQNQAPLDLSALQHLLLKVIMEQEVIRRQVIAEFFFCPMHRDSREKRSTRFDPAIRFERACDEQPCRRGSGGDALAPLVSTPSRAGSSVCDTVLCDSVGCSCCFGFFCRPLCGVRTRPVKHGDLSNSRSSCPSVGDKSPPSRRLCAMVLNDG